MTQLEFEIDELVLIGFNPRDRHRIADALQQALAEHAREAGLVSAVLAHEPSRALVRGADITLARATTMTRPEEISSGIAASLTGALRGDKA